MSGPKCDEIVLNKEEEQRLRAFYEEQLRREREAFHRKRREERERQLRLEEQKKKQREEARKRRAEEEKRTIRDYRDGVAGYVEELQKLEEADREEYEEAYETYLAACTLAGETPRSFRYEQTEREKLIGELKRESETLKERAVAFACEEQVEQRIDQVIEEMGYHIIGKKEQAGEARAVSKLYRYDAHTALHVIGAAGQFTMEIVATDNSDRALRESEREELVDSMEHFCEDYREIREKLEQSGELEMKPVFHLPVDRKYAALINEADYRKTQKKRIPSRGADYMDASAGEEARRRYQ